MEALILVGNEGENLVILIGDCKKSIITWLFSKNENGTGLTYYKKSETTINAQQVDERAMSTGMAYNQTYFLAFVYSIIS
ncbi:hypothetical protein QL285_005169 [Trifolium repens]|nr:hypothetical protein QL285_005169 [Trifolium repens]